MPGKLVDDANADAVLRLRSTEEIGDEELVFVGKREQEIVVEPVEGTRVHRLVAIVPPDDVFRERVLDGELVLSAATSVATGPDDQWSILPQEALAPAHCMLDQRCGGQVPEYLGGRRETLRIKPVLRDAVTHSNISLF